jgi:hypothetical protein
MNSDKDYVVCKILDVRFEYKDEPIAIEAIDKILKKLNVEVQNVNQNKDESN